MNKFLHREQSANMTCAVPLLLLCLPSVLFYGQRLSAFLTSQRMQIASRVERLADVASGCNPGGTEVADFTISATALLSCETKSFKYTLGFT